MLPEVILHNSIILVGSLTNFDVNMELHYHIAATYKPDAHLIGSNTIKSGIELYGSSPPEETKDFVIDLSGMKSSHIGSLLIQKEFSKVFFTR